MLIFVLAAFLQSPPPVRTIGKGPTSAIEAAQTVAVRTAAEWSVLWRRHGGAGEPPPVDFAREMVLGVFLGTRPTAGHGVEIVRTVGSTGGMVVEYVESVPARGAVTAQVLTSPYHLAVVPKNNGEVRFQKVAK